MSAVGIGTNLSRIMLFLAFVAGIYTVDTGKASAQETQQCAPEGGICRLPYPTEVIYGKGRRTTSRFINNPTVPCTNNVFGDPSPGRGKSCSYVVRDNGRGGYGRDNGRGGYGRDQGRGDYGRDGYGRGRDGRDGYGRDRDYGRDNGRGGQWQRCAREGQFCDFSGRKTVRYGTQERFVERVFRGGVSCDNRTFGDPDRGNAKSCYILN